LVSSFDFIVHYSFFTNVLNVQVSDTTGDDKRTKAGNKI